MRLDDERWSNLPGEMRDTLRAYVNALAAVFGQALEAVILYGSAARGDYVPGRSNVNVLVVLGAYDLAAMTRYARQHGRWAKEGIVTPLFFSQRDLDAAVELFPLEYLEMRSHHVVLSGRDPFPSKDPDPQRLLAQCLAEIRGNLVRLRQRFVEGGGTPDAIAILLPISVTALLPCLRGLAFLWGRAGLQKTEALFGELAPALGVDGQAFAEAWQVKAGLSSPGQAELPRLFERYTTALEHLADCAHRVADRGDSCAEG